MIVIGLVGLVLVLVLSLAWTGRLLYVSALDAHDLGVKLATPRPVSVSEWPELHLQSVVVDPTNRDQLVLVAQWPAHPERRSIVVLALDASAARRVASWCDRGVALSPLRLEEQRLSLRRRRSTHSIEARIIDETPWLQDGPSKRLS